MQYGKTINRIFTVLLSAFVLTTGFAGAAEAATRAEKSATKKTSAKKTVSRKKAVRSVRKASSTSAKSRRNVRASRQVAKRPTVVRQQVERDFDSEGNPLIRSAAFVVQDLTSGQILLERNSQAALPIASITKLMTVMVVLDAQQDLSQTLEIGDEDIDRLKGTGSRLAVGTQLTREEAMRLALMASENRAASALGRHYPGGTESFLQAMNDKARALGMLETRFYDGTGLNKHNVSSARDLATLVSSASRYPLVREFSTSTEYAIAVRGRTQTFRNTNALVKSSDWQIGVSKTGYINESGKCLVMQAWMGDKPVAIVLLDSAGRFTRLGDANRIRKWVETAMAQQPLVSAISNPVSKLAH